MRVAMLMSALTGFLLVTTPNVYCDPPERIEVMPTQTHAFAGVNCEGSCVVSAPPQKIRVEMSPPEIVIQQANCPPKPQGGGLLQQCCHFHRSCGVPVMPVQQAVMPMYYAQPQAVMSYAVAPPVSYAVAPPVSYAVAPPVTYAAPPVSYAAPPVSYAVQPPAYQPATYTTQPITFSVQPITFGVQPAGAQGQQPGAQGTGPGKEDINDTIKQLNQHLQGLIKVVDRHHDYIVNHEDRLKKLEMRVDELEKSKLKMSATK